MSKKKNNNQRKKTANEMNKQKFSVLPKSTGLAIAVVICGFAEVLFLMFLLALDVIPFKYIASVIIVLLLIDFVILLLTNAKTRKKTKHIASLVLIVFLLNVLLMGDFYVYSTYDTLQKIGTERDTWEYYNVITTKDSSYEKADDIEGLTVGVVNMESKQLTEARERLITKEDVEYDERSDMYTLAKSLYNGEQKSSDESTTGTTGEATSSTNGGSTSTSIEPTEDKLIMLANSQHQIVKDNIKGFKKNTKVIYRIKVKKRADDTSKRVNVTEDSFNVLISGVDQWGGIDQGGLSDVNMVMTVNPVSKEILLTSIPRDSYVPLHSSGAMDKLTHSAIYGEEETKQTIEDFLDTDINYTIKVNFSMLVDVINAIDGLDIYSEYDFKSAISDHKFHKGWQHLSGSGCLYFARERKAFLDGDMQRNKHQQVVLKAALEKVTSSKVIITRYTQILNAVEDEMVTTLTDKDLKKLAKMQLRDMKKWKVTTVSIEGSTGGAPCYSMGNQELSCVFPSEESVDEAKQKIHDTMFPGENVKEDKKDKEE